MAGQEKYHQSYLKISPEAARQANALALRSEQTIAFWLAKTPQFDKLSRYNTESKQRNQLSFDQAKILATFEACLLAADNPLFAVSAPTLFREYRMFRILELMSLMQRQQTALFVGSASTIFEVGGYTINPPQFRHFPTGDNFFINYAHSFAREAASPNLSKQASFSPTTAVAIEPDPSGEHQPFLTKLATNLAPTKIEHHKKGIREYLADNIDTRFSTIIVNRADPKVFQETPGDENATDTLVAQLLERVLPGGSLCFTIGQGNNFSEARLRYQFIQSLPGAVSKIIVNPIHYLNAALLAKLSPQDIQWLKTLPPGNPDDIQLFTGGMDHCAFAVIKKPAEPATKYGKGKVRSLK